MDTNCCGRRRIDAKASSHSAL